MISRRTFIGRTLAACVAPFLPTPKSKPLVFWYRSDFIDKCPPQGYLDKVRAAKNILDAQPVPTEGRKMWMNKEARDTMDRDLMQLHLNSYRKVFQPAEELAMPYGPNDDHRIPDITERDNHAFQLHEVEAEPDGEYCTICGDYTEDIEDGMCKECREAD